MATQSFIPTGLQKDLDARIASAGGDVAKIRREVEAEVQALEVRNPEGQHQVQIALLRGELLYLDSLLRAADESAEQPAPNLWQRLSNIFKRNKEVTA